MAIKARNFVTGDGFEQLKQHSFEVLPIERQQPVQKPRISVASKLQDKISEARRAVEERAQRLAERKVPSFREVVEKAKQKASIKDSTKENFESKVEKTSTQQVGSTDNKHIEEAKPVYSMSLSMSDQIMKSSKYLQDLTTKET